MVEHSLAQVNQFQVLAQVFHHDRARHSGLTRTVLTNFADGAPERMAWHIAVLSLPALAETASADEGLPTGL